MSVSRQVRVGILDSGINPRHRQIGADAVSGGVGIHVSDGEVVFDDDWDDQLGHGTAVAATVRAEAPAAALVAIRIFRRRLQAHVEALLAGITWAAEHEVDVLCASLGCPSLVRRSDFERVVSGAGLTIVAAASLEGAPSLPGALSGVIRVAAEPSLDAGALRYEDGVFYAPPWASSMEPLPREQNLSGTSLAVAHVSGRVAALLGAGTALERPPEAALRASIVR